jgi:enoyl-CoA hydratase/carnithine racemase
VTSPPRPYSTLEVTRDGELGRITLNRPAKLNALSTTMLRELATAAADLDTHGDVKVVIVAGNGRAFSAGADLAAFTAPTDAGASAVEGESVRASADAGRAMADAIESMQAVTVARIHGHCVGGGVVLAAACDLRVAAASTRFSIPEVALGIPLAWGGIPRLVREIGPARTRELVMTCRPFGADEAHAMGFVNQVATDEGLDAAVDALVNALLSKSALVLDQTKRAVHDAAEALVATTGSWSDADALQSALHDPESRAVAAAYLERLTRP